MAEEDAGAGDRTEEATPERRDEFRERGQIAVSREITSVFVLAACVIAFTSGAPAFMRNMQRFMTTQFEALATRRIDQGNILGYLGGIWVDLLKFVIPIFIVTLITSSATTLLQTRLNWSWERVKPDFSRLEPLAGLGRMVTMQALVELVKSTAKMIAVGTVAYLILRSEWVKVPGLMAYPMQATWLYWGSITRTLFWAVAGFLLAIAAADWFYNFITLERQMKMTKQEVKEDFKRREVDPHVKAKMRRMQRDMANKKVLEKTRKATVLITNPTHYAIALRYDPADGTAPVLVTKGVDFLALQMREVAKEEKIPIIENRPLARELYATVEEGEEIPDKFYKVVAEIIRYVFRIKGRRVPQGRAKQAPKPPPMPPPTMPPPDL